MLQLVEVQCKLFDFGFLQHCQRKQGWNFLPLIDNSVELYFSNDNMCKKKDVITISNILLLAFQDYKFNTGPDGSWRPEHAGAEVKRSSNWEDGLGRGDIEKNRKDRERLEIKRDANQRYHEQIAKDSMEKQQKERARQDYHRLVTVKHPNGQKDTRQRPVNQRLTNMQKPFFFTEVT